MAVSTLVAAGCGGKEAATTNEIRLGANFELTGGVAQYGQSAANGIKLAIKEANAAGGVLGKQIKLVVADNKSEPAEAGNATTKLITQDKVIAIFGPAASSNVLASTQIAQDNKIPLLTPTGTNTKITVDNGKVKDFAFRSCFIDPFQGQVMASFAQKTVKAKTAAIYIDSSSDYSKSLSQNFEEVFVKNGGTIVAKEAFLQKDQDFKAALTKIKAVNPDVIYIPAYYEEVGKIIKQARELGITAPLLGSDGWDSPKLAEIAGAAALNNTFFTNHYSSQDKDPMVQKFVESYKKEYGQEPDAFAVLGYDGALMMIDAIKRANSTDS
ncbi:ABC transporter substrate-binding protein, partial [Anaerospora hongkongensis]